jgi:hypothetical protein
MSTNPNEAPGGQGYPGSDYPGGQYPQQPGYSGYPSPPAGGYPGTPQQQQQPGFNLQDLLHRWQAVLTKPGVPTFDAQQSGANWSTIWISLIGYGIVQAILGFIGNLANRQQNAPNAFSAFGYVIWVPLGFFIGAGILHLIAKAFGGTSSFLTYSWLLSLVYVPLGLFASVAGIVPFVGIALVLGAGVYQVLLSIYATASAQRLTLGRSTLVVLLPVIASIVVAIIVAVIVTTIMVSSGTVPTR